MNDFTIQIPVKNESGDIEPIKERKKLTHQEVAIMLDKYDFKLTKNSFYIFINIFLGVPD